MGVYARKIYKPSGSLIHMPSKKAGEELRAIIKNVRDGSFQYENREQTKTDWAKYDSAQISEMANYLDNLRDIVNEADYRIKSRTPPKKRGPGKPETNPADISKTLLLQTYTGSPNRIAEGLLLLFREKLGIGEHFSYKTIERGYDREKVNKILDEIVVLTNECVENEEKTCSFDGTGHSASNKENYADKRQKQNSKKRQKKLKNEKDNQCHDSFPLTNLTSNRGFSYSVMGIGVKYKLISGMSVCPDHSIGETTMFPEAYFQTLRSYPNLENVLGDGIYAARWITDLVSKTHLTPYFLPKSNVTFQSKGFSGWYDMLYSLWDDPQKWLEQYHMRSISETVNSMVKCRFGATQRKKLNPRKATETKLKNVAHDIRRIGYIGILYGIKPKWPCKGCS
jgi:transposase